MKLRQETVILILPILLTSDVIDMVYVEAYPHHT
jgi:hypothetical protein